MQRTPNGYKALAEGAVWQQKVADAYQAQGYETRLGWGHDEPDVLVLDDADFHRENVFDGEPYPPEAYFEGKFIIDVVSVKVANVVPSNERRGESGKLEYASSRTFYRKDLQPEIDFVQQHWSPSFLLTIINTWNGGAVEHLEIYPFAYRPEERFGWSAFDHYSTTKRLTMQNPETLLAGDSYTDEREIGIETMRRSGWRAMHVKEPWYPLSKWKADILECRRKEKETPSHDSTAFEYVEPAEESQVEQAKPEEKIDWKKRMQEAFAEFRV